MSDLGVQADRLDPVLHGNSWPGWVLGSSSGSSCRSCLRTYCACPVISTTAIYIAAVLGFFVLWARTTGQRLGVMVRRRWRLAVVLGLVFAVVLGFFVVRAEPATSGPEGLALAWAVLWRGVAYGAADGLLLSAFPILAVFAAAEGSDRRRRRSGTFAVGAVGAAGVDGHDGRLSPRLPPTSARRCWPGP